MSSKRFSNWIDYLLKETPLRANSLIITLFGDAIAPHGGAVLLGDLISILAPLGINERAVRTSAFRLLQEDWLHATPVGRRSEYSLTASGYRRISHAYRRIYDSPKESWLGNWQIVIFAEGALQPAAREALRRDLLWDGYGAIAPGVYALPSDDAGPLRELLAQSGNETRVAVLRAKALDSLTDAPLRSLVEQCWRLDRLAEDYQRFLSRFSIPRKLLQREGAGDPAQHFMLRTLLIHEFRRVQLRDPQLPETLLPRDWPGHTARAVCREIYERTLPLSECHLFTTLRTRNGTLPPADATLLDRFGGLTEDD